MEESRKSFRSVAEKRFPCRTHCLNYAIEEGATNFAGLSESAEGAVGSTGAGCKFR